MCVGVVVDRQLGVVVCVYVAGLRWWWVVYCSRLYMLWAGLWVQVVVCVCGKSARAMQQHLGGLLVHGSSRGVGVHGS